MSPPTPPQPADRVIAPGLAFPRVLSASGVRPLDAVPWINRDLRGLSGAEAFAPETLQDIAVPLDWTGQAALAFLRSQRKQGAVNTPDDARDVALDVRQALEEIATHLRDQGLAAGYFVRPEDAAIFADEIACLLVLQMAAFSAADAAAESSALSSGLQPRRRLTPETPGLADLLTERGGERTGTARLELELSQAFLKSAEDGQGSRGKIAQTTLHFVAECIRDGAEPVLAYTDVNISDGLGFGELLQSMASSPPAATLNLARFLAPDGRFNLVLFCHVVHLLTTALEISISARAAAGHATHALASRRPLALGFANFGALLMESGLPYDAERSRSIAGAIAAVLCGEALAQSARIAETCRPLNDRIELRQQPMRSATTGACEAFERDPAAALARLRRSRAAALRLGTAAEASDPAQADLSASPASNRSASSLRSTDTASPPLSANRGLGQQLPLLLAAARSAWDRALTGAELFGLRNMELTALSQDRAVANILDCDTLGVAPEDSLLQPARRTPTGQPAAGRVRRVVEAALFRLGYPHLESGEILAAIEHSGDLSRAPRLRPEHRIIFAVAPPSQPPAVPGIPRERLEAEPSRVRRHGDTVRAEESSVISAAAILQMFAAVEPFLGTHVPLALTLPPATSSAQITTLLQQGGRLGIRLLHLQASPGTIAQRPDRAASSEPLRILSFVDRIAGGVAPDADRTLERGSRLRRDHAALLDMQLSRTAETLAESKLPSRRADTPRTPASQLPGTTRSPLPAERASVTHAFSVAGHHGSITVSLYPDGVPGEISIRMTTGGAVLTGLLDALSTAISLALQHGVPLRTFAEHVTPSPFEPAGNTANPQIPYARSVVDYMFRWLELRFLTPAHLLPGE